MKKYFDYQVIFTISGHKSIHDEQTEKDLIEVFRKTLEEYSVQSGNVTLNVEYVGEEIKKD